MESVSPRQHPCACTRAPAHHLHASSCSGRPGVEQPASEAAHARPCSPSLPTQSNPARRRPPGHSHHAPGLSPCTVDIALISTCMTRPTPPARCQPPAARESLATKSLEHAGRAGGRGAGRAAPHAARRASAQSATCAGRCARGAWQGVAGRGGHTRHVSLSEPDSDNDYVTVGKQLVCLTR